MHKPTVIHFSVVKRILRYLRGSPTLGIKFHKGLFSLQIFCDSDWVGDIFDQHSTSGFIAFLGSNPISWSSKKQFTVFRSSTEVEYRSLATTMLTFTGSHSFSVISMFLLRPHQHYGVIMFSIYLWLIIQFFMLEPNTSRLITILFRKKFFAKTSPFVTSLPTTN
ncbi:hypothetical protein IC582_024609 [Cucumis melo]